MEKNVEDEIVLILEKMVKNIEDENKEYLNAREFEYSFYISLIKNFKNISTQSIERDLKGYSNKINKTLFGLFISKKYNYFVPNYKTLDWLKRTSFDLTRLLNWDGKSEVKLDFNSLKKTIFQIRNPMRWKFFIAVILCSNINFSQKFKDLLDFFFKFASYGNCEYFLKKIFAIYEEYYPNLKNETPLEKISGNEDVSDSDEKENLETIKIEDIESEFSKDKFIELYNENILLHQQLDAAQGTADYFKHLFNEKNEELNKFIKSWEFDMKIKIFQSFNSVQSNYTLDNFHIAKQIFQKLKDEIWVSNHPDLNDLLYFITLFDEFLKSQKVYPIYKVDDILDLTFEKVKNFDYKGSEFVSEVDVKKVKVKTPGWQIDNVVICKPSVIEIQKTK